MPKTKSVISVTFWLTLTIIGGLCATLSGFYLYLAPKLPTVESLRETKFQIPLRIYTRDGLLIGEFGEKRRSPIEYQQIPEAFIQAILSAEDDRFYSHSGVDMKGLLRALSQILKTGEIQSGGSTITMQVARNFFLSREQVFTRKFNEILLSLQIERELTKQEILSLYVNKIYLGNRAYGIQAAAQIYYGQNIDQLSLAQLAMIAGLPKAPSAYNPIANPERALIRRDWILSRMESLGYIDNTAYAHAVAEPITAKNHGSVVELEAPYVAEMARKELINRYGLSAYTDGYMAFVTADSQLQKAAQEAVIKGLEEYDQRHGYRGPETKLPTLALIQEPFALERDSDLSADLASSAAELDSPTANPQENAPEVQAGDAQPLPPQQHVRAEFDREAWLSQLQKTPKLASLHAAAVVAVSDSSIKIMLADGTESILGLDDGLSGQRAYISENRRARAYESPSDFLEPGDVIRVKPSSAEGWRLTQVPAVQGAMVALDPNNGAILSLVGGYDFGQSHFNRAVQAQRQPGSNFKPFVYAAALEQGFTAATQVNDAPIVFDDEYLEATWRPENSSGKFYGPTRLREALYNSRNLVSIRVLRNIGIDTALSAIGNYGFNTRDFPRDLSIALGSHAITPLEVATGYAVLANGGYLVEPYLIDRVITTEGELISQANPARVCNADCQRQVEQDALAVQASAELALLEAQPLSAQEHTGQGDEPSVDRQALDDDHTSTAIETPPAMIAAPRVMDERVNYLINSMLRDVITKGTGRKALALKRGDLAGKTGTTNGPTDAWFSGFNSDIIASAWVGFDQNQLLGTREYGGSAALPIWIDFMAQALAGQPEQPASPPDGIVTVKIDPETGLSARIDDPDAVFEVFREELAPAGLDGESSQVAESIENLF